MSPILLIFACEMRNFDEWCVWCLCLYKDSTSWLQRGQTPIIDTHSCFSHTVKATCGVSTTETSAAMFATIFSWCSTTSKDFQISKSSVSLKKWASPRHFLCVKISRSSTNDFANKTLRMYSSATLALSTQWSLLPTTRTGSGRSPTVWSCSMVNMCQWNPCLSQD